MEASVLCLPDANVIAAEASGGIARQKCSGVQQCLDDSRRVVKSEMDIWIGERVAGCQSCVIQG